MPHFKVLKHRTYLVMYPNTDSVKKVIKGGEIIELPDINVGGQASKLTPCRKPANTGPSAKQIKLAEIKDVSDQANTEIERINGLLDQHAAHLSPEFIESAETTCKDVTDLIKGAKEALPIKEGIEKLSRLAEEIETDPNISQDGGSVEDAKKLL